MNSFLISLKIPAGCSGLRHHKSPVAVSEDQSGAHDRLLENFFAESPAEADQDPRKVADTSSERTNGGRGKAGAVSAGDVRRHPGRESAGGGVRTRGRVPGSLLESHASAGHFYGATCRAGA